MLYEAKKNNETGKPCLKSMLVTGQINTHLKTLKLICTDFLKAILIELQYCGAHCENA